MDAYRDASSGGTVRHSAQLSCASHRRLGETDAIMRSVKEGGLDCSNKTSCVGHLDGCLLEEYSSWLWISAVCPLLADDHWRQERTNYETAIFDALHTNFLRVHMCY